MTLGEKIKHHRQQARLSQEKLAELVGVSRQAVTKWESDQSAPSTQNLFRLAEIFGTTVDLLIASGEPEPSQAEQIYTLYKGEKAEARKARLDRIRRNAAAALVAAGVYLGFYLIGRLIWCDFSRTTVLGWLFAARPEGEGSYLYGWLLSSGLFWLAMVVCVGGALLGKWKFSAVTAGYFLIGFLLGLWLGPNPAGAYYGHGDDGWAYWSGLYLVSIPVGVLVERNIKPGVTLRSAVGRRLAALILGSIVLVTALIRLSVPDWR